MKKSLFHLLALTAAFGLAASCGGGGDDDGYNFEGRWATTEVVTASNVPGVPVGAVDNDVLIIDQNGNSVTVQFESIRSECIMQGPADPDARTFSASGICGGDMAGVRIDINGTGVDDDSLSGAYAFSFAGRTIFANYTANLISRALAASAPAGRAGKFGAILLQ